MQRLSGYEGHILIMVENVLKSRILRISIHNIILMKQQSIIFLFYIFIRVELIFFNIILQADNVKLSSFPP